MRRFLAGVIGGIVLLVVLAWLFLWSGFYNVAAAGTPGLVEATLAGFAFDHSLARRAPDRKNPLAAGPETWGQALPHYRDDCLVCHGAPGVERSDISRGMNPPPPALDSRGTQEMSDGELYWVIANGVRMTGMPAFEPSHSPDDLWRLVAFVRHLPALGPDEIERLRKSGAPDHD